MNTSGNFLIHSFWTSPGLRVAVWSEGQEAVKPWPLRIAVVLSSLALLVMAGCGGYLAEEFRDAVRQGIKTGDFSRADRLKAEGADTEVWREEDSGKQLLEATKGDDWKKVQFLLKTEVRVNVRDDIG